MKLLIAGGLFFLLLFSFGCLGAKEKPAGTGSPSVLGDADISPQANPDDASVMPQEDVVPQDNEAVQGSSLSVSDIDVIQMDDSGVISDQDVVGPE
jgi:hypothetical protein